MTPEIVSCFPLFQSNIPQTIAFQMYQFITRVIALWTEMKGAKVRSNLKTEWENPHEDTCLYYPFEMLSLRLVWVATKD